MARRPPLTCSAHQPHSAPIKVCVTGAAGQIGYALLPLIANGSMLGSAQPVALRLLDLPHASRALQGIAMELEDSVYPLLTGARREWPRWAQRPTQNAAAPARVRARAEVVVTSDVRTAFQDVEVAVLVGAFPRGKGMERRDLLARNAAIFKEQGAVLNEVAHPNVKVGSGTPARAAPAHTHAPHACRLWWWAIQPTQTRSSRSVTLRGFPPATSAR